MAPYEPNSTVPDEGGSPNTLAGATPEAKLKVFISYSRKDEDFAQDLLGGLQLTGFEPFLDKHDIAPGEDWEARLSRLIESADTVVFIISPDAIASERCAWEVRRTIDLKKRLMPIVFRRVEEMRVPQPLRQLNYIFFDRPFAFVASLQMLAGALRVDIDWIREHTRQAELAARWQERGRPESMLLRGDTLEICKAWVARRQTAAPEITELQLDFFNASDAAEKARQSEERQFLDQMRAALEAEKAAQQERANALAAAAAALRKGQWVLSLAAGLFGCIVVGVFGWWNQALLMEQYQWRVMMGPRVLSSSRENELTLMPGSEFKECANECPTMIVVPSGSFIMGSPDIEEGKAKDEDPQHKVTIDKPFAVSKFAVTFAEWNRCVAAGACPRATDSGWGQDDRPVINVSWDDAKVYVAWLRRLTGKPYRLLSEAEWEYAARAGNQARWFFGDDIEQLDQYAWYTRNSNAKTQPVGKKKANAFGLYDMHGNVWQWVEDPWHENYFGAPLDGSVWSTNGDASRHVFRGGCFGNIANDLRSASRRWWTTDHRDNYLGLRLGRTLKPEPSR